MDNKGHCLVRRLFMAQYRTDLQEASRRLFMAQYRTDMQEAARYVNGKG